jgi:hypothetical protein
MRLRMRIDCDIVSSFLSFFSLFFFGDWRRVELVLFGQVNRGNVTRAIFHG